MILRGVTGTSLSVATLASLTWDMLNRTQPEVVLAPLLTDAFDIIDVGRRLMQLGYTGALRAFCQPVPNRHLIRSEVQGACHLLDFDLLEVTPPRN